MIYESFKENLRKCYYFFLNSFYVGELIDIQHVHVY